MIFTRNREYLTRDKHKVTITDVSDRIYGVLDGKGIEPSTHSWNLHGQYDFGFSDGKNRTHNKCAYDIVEQI